MTKTLIALVAIVLLAAGGIYFYQDTTGVAEAGEYAYQCEDGSQFSMTPSENVAEVTLFPGSGAKFTSSITVHKMGDGNHFEADNIVFWGAGEEVGLEVGSDSTVCNPVPNSEMAPWNWGDAGEGAGSMQDTVAAVQAGLDAKWKSADDAKFERHFFDGGKVVDRYNGEISSAGTYVIFTNTDPRAAAFPETGDTIYIQIVLTGNGVDVVASQAEILTFKVLKITPEELELSYMDRGNTLRFTKVQ
jgi:hypothetical protein